MRVYKTRWFARFARNEDITDDRLADAIAFAERGLVSLGNEWTQRHQAIVAPAQLALALG